MSKTPAQETVQKSPPASEDHPARTIPWALAGLSLSMLTPSLATSIANVGLPSMAQAFGASFQQTQWIVLAYLLAITALIVSAGRLGDLFGRRRLLLIGISLFTVASLLCGIAPTLPLLIAARVAQGLGAAIMMALTVAMVGATIPKERTGSAMGLLGTMSAIGTTLGPSAGGMLIAGAGWRMIFLINVPLGILNFLLAQHHLPSDDRDNHMRQKADFDAAGTVLLAITLVAYALSMTVGRGHFGLLNISLLLAVVFGITFFILAEAGAATPLIQLEMFREPMLGAGLAMSAMVSAVMMTTLVVGPFHLSRGLGLDAAQVGLVLSVGPLAAALAGVPAGRLVDRFGSRSITFIGLVAMAAGSTSLFLIPADFKAIGYIAPIVIITTGYALFQTANNTALMTGVPHDQRGVVSGMLNLSRNLGLITGASVMGAVFAHASSATDITYASPGSIVHGTQLTFAMAALLIMGAMAIASSGRLLFINSRKTGIAAGFIGFLLGSGNIHAQDMTRSTGLSPASADPYPLKAAGWGPEAGNGLFYSRWAEDWTDMRAAGNAPPLKAMPLGNDASLTLSAETRMRYETYDNAPPSGGDLDQGLFRGIFGADLRINSNFRLYGEIGGGQVADRRDEAAANYQNDFSLQQLFMDLRGYAGSTLIGAMAGRQEFADGPRQLISLSDGPNLHRTWNGLRFYAHGERFRVGAFDFRATRLESGGFDEEINHDERIRGLNGSIVLSSGPDVYLDPFWIHSENPNFSSDGKTGPDDRDTYGVRLWGKRRNLTFDWTLAHQSGESTGRDIDAWGLFAVHSLALSENGWKPRLTAHIDIASGGTGGNGTTKGFNPLYVSSNHLGEGRFLGLSNLILIAPGISFSPTEATRIAIEYGIARKFTEDDAVYAGGMRAYPGTQDVRGREIGGLLRVSGSWTASESLTLSFDYEHLAAGDVLKCARVPSGSFAYIGATFRY